VDYLQGNGTGGKGRAMKLIDTYTALFVDDVKACPNHYLQFIRLNPESYIRDLMQGHSDKDIQRFISELQDEIRTVRGAL
jgi:hypothetical protein